MTSRFAPWLLTWMVALASSAWGATGRERSVAVYPPQKIPIAFDHAKHLEAGAECVSCHDSATKSSQSSDRNLPKHPECETCHDIEAAAAGKPTDPKAGCQDCHLGFDFTVQKAPVRLELPAPNLVFDHQIHVAKKVECRVCHGAMTDVEVATRMQLPKMETCLYCHDGKHAESTCKTCHPTTPAGKLQQSFASGMLRPTQGNPFGIDHGPRYEFNHANRATTDRETCMQCHTNAQCQSCHDSLRKPISVHPNDFITLHPVQARAQITRCTACHREQSFCASCHERVGVGLDADPTLRAKNVRVHPDYATFVQNPGPLHHGIQASRDINQCISCHREETCKACHAETALGAKQQVDPHPPGFQASCKKLAARNDRPCLQCHQESSLQAYGCR